MASSVLSAGAFALLLAVAGSEPGLDRGALATGDRYVSGGIGQEEIAQLVEERSGYTLWLVTAARKSGAHLADVRVRIARSSGAVVFDKLLAGPWLLADLPPGTYTIEADYRGESHKNTATIRSRTDSRQVIVYFGVDADVQPRD